MVAWFLFVLLFGTSLLAGIQAKWFILSCYTVNTYLGAVPRETRQDRLFQPKCKNPRVKYFSDIFFVTFITMHICRESCGVLCWTRTVDNQSARRRETKESGNSVHDLQPRTNLRKWKGQCYLHWQNWRKRLKSNVATKQQLLALEQLHQWKVSEL